MVAVRSSGAGVTDGGGCQTELGLRDEESRHGLRRGRQCVDAAGGAPGAEDRKVALVGRACGWRLVLTGKVSCAIEIGLGERWKLLDAGRDDDGVHGGFSPGAFWWRTSAM